MSLADMIRDKPNLASTPDFQPRGCTCFLTKTEVWYTKGGFRASVVQRGCAVVQHILSAVNIMVHMCVPGHASHVSSKRHCMPRQLPL